MRVLFSFVGGTGHFLPTVPIAKAVVARGHQVIYTCQTRMLHVVDRTGFGAVDSGGLTLTDPTPRLPRVAVDPAAEVAVVREVFAGSVARERAPRVLELARRWSADVLIRDETDFGAAVAAERLGRPHVPVTVLAAGGMTGPGGLDQPMDDLRRVFELPPANGAAFLDRYLVLSPLMPSFRDTDFPLPDTAFPLRPGILDEPGAADDPAVRRTAAWLATRPAWPLVYVTLGTVFHQESGDLFHRVLAGLAELPTNVLVTVGREIHPSELGDPPANSMVERFVPQAAVLPRCDAVVSHAGSGTVISALACGVPLVVLPMGADQPWNADRCAALGVGRVLDALTASSADIAEAVHEVLTAPAYRTAARRLRAEALALPTSADAAARLERLGEPATGLA